jgi:hypothetical protein
MEHRCGYRHEVHLPIYLQTQGGLAAHGSIRDASVSGAFIETPLPLRVLSHVWVHVLAKNPAHKSDMILEGEVVRATDSGLAIEWSEIALELIRYAAQAKRAESHRKNLTQSSKASSFDLAEPVRQDEGPGAGLAPGR